MEEGGGWYRGRVCASWTAAAGGSGWWEAKEENGRHARYGSGGTRVFVFFGLALALVWLICLAHVWLFWHYASVPLYDYSTHYIS